MNLFRNIFYFFPLLVLTACPLTEDGATPGGGEAKVTPAPTDNPSPSVSPDNTGDIISGDFPTSGTVGVHYEYTPSANVSGVIFSIQNKPSWASFTTGTGTLSGTPDVAGTLSDIQVTGTAGGKSTTLTFTIIVGAADAAFSGTYPTSVLADHLYSFTPTSLVGGVAYTIQNKPSWATFNTSTGKLEGTPTTPATHSDIGITGTAGARTNSVTFAIEVTENSPTSLISGSFPTAGKEDFLYSYTPTANTSGITFSIANMPSWATFNTSNGKLSGAMTAGTFSDIEVTGTKAGKSTTLTFTITISGDPLSSYQWHLHNTGQTSFATNPGTSGEDMKVLEVLQAGYSGNGIKIAVSDSGMEIAHEDLASNVIANQSRDYKTAAPYTGNPTNNSDTDGDHGTSVSGIIAAVAGNSKGGRGIAPASGIAGFNFLGPGVSQTNAVFLDQLQGNFDIFNQSWGSSLDFYADLDDIYIAQLKSGVDTQRSGKGSLFIRAAGNEFNFRKSNGQTAMIGSTKLSLPAGVDALNSPPYVIVVGAMNAKGKKSSYSSAGSCLWIAGLGGAYGTTDPAMVTTDQSSCAKGYSPTYYASSIPFQAGTIALNSSCNYTNIFNGTSSASPSITGVVALLLEANPNLTWRDVKHILASTATKVDSSIAAQTRSIDPSGYVYEDAWTTNAAGFHFHNWYGFGRANALDAVNMAKNYSTNLGTYIETNFGANTGTISVAIPDNNKTGISRTLSVSQDLIIEAVQIKLSVTHTYPGDLAFELYSPSGTKSIVLNGNSAMGFESRSQNLSSVVLTSNAFYGEHSNGTWTLKVIDIFNSDTGTLTNFRINIAGH